MTDLDRLNDQLRQRAHAEEVRQRRAEREGIDTGGSAVAAGGPGGGLNEMQVHAIAEAVAAQVVRKMMSGFKIQSGQNMNFSGTGFSITGACTLQLPNAQQGGSGVGGDGVWTDFTDCDGNTFQVWTRNFVAP